jgi:hypothetical protein
LTSLAHQNNSKTLKIIILSKKKFKFWATDVLAAMPNTPLSWTIEGGNSNANFKANLYLIVSNQSFKFFL